MGAEVKRIIFDEVHCISQAEDGVIWEQLLLLAPCPIIALSATVGNPLDFKDWLAGTQKARRLGTCDGNPPVRYSDLRKFLYAASENLGFRGFLSKEQLSASGLDAEDSNLPLGLLHSPNR